MSSRSRLSLILIPFCLLSIFSCVTEPEPEPDTINIHVRGTVTSEVNGSPIDSVHIILYDFVYNFGMPSIIVDPKVWIETYTDSFGFYELKEEIPLLADLELSLKVSKPGHYVSAQSVEWSENVQIRNFQLSPYTPPP